VGARESRLVEFRASSNGQKGTPHGPLRHNDPQLQSREDAFAYLADLENFAEWDPGVSSASQVDGDGPGLGAAYDVKAGGAALRYEVIEFASPNRMVAEAKTMFFRSYDIIEVVERSDGCDVTYDATLELNGPFGLLDFGLRLFFDKIGNKAAAGMITALNGTKIR